MFNGGAQMFNLGHNNQYLQDEEFILAGKIQLEEGGGQEGENVHKETLGELLGPIW